MRKFQNQSAVACCFLFLIALGACNTSTRNVPFPKEESEFTAPATEKLSFSEPKKFEWITKSLDSFQPARTEKLDLDKIPSKPIDLGNATPLLQPMKDTAFDLKSFPDTAFNIETAPSQKLKFKMAVLGQPKRTKSGIPRLKDGASESLLKFGMDQGLSGTIYSDFKQDKNGILWIATDDGLNRFDGEYCEIYSMSQGLLGSWILQTLIDREDQVWIKYQTGNGVSVINKKTGIIKHLTIAEGLSSNNVRRILEDKKGRIWITTDKGINIIDQKAGTIKLLTKNQGISGNNSGFIFQDSKDRIWVRCGPSLDQINENAGTIKHIKWFTDSKIFVNSVYEDKLGHIWFATFNSGLMMLDENAGVIKKLSTVQGFTNDPISGLAFDEKDRIWIATDGSGAYVFNAIDQTIKNFNAARGLNNDRVNSILADNQHQVWIGMNGGEANIYNIAGGNIHHLTSSSGLSNKSSFYYGFAQDDQSRVYVSSLQGSGLDIIDEKNGTFKTVSTLNGLSTNIINDLFTDSRGRIWISSNRSDILDVIDEKNGRILHLDSAQGISKSGTNSVFEDSQGQIWLVRGDAIFVINEKNRTIRNIPFNKDFLFIQSNFVEDNNGQVWAGTDYGVVVINEKEGTIKHLFIKGLKDFNGQNLLKDSHGNIWIGTYGNGLFMANPAAGTITNFSVANGLANDVMYTVNERNGAIYAASGKGPTVITPNTNEKSNGTTTPSWKIKSYGKPQGFLRVDHNPRSLLAKDGKLWFGIADVLTIMGEPESDSTVPPTFISGLDIMGKPQNFLTNKIIQSGLQETDTIWNIEKDTFYLKNNLPADDGFLKKNIVKWDSVTGPYNLPVDLRLPYEVNQIGFHFTGMHLDNMDKTKYRYILEGADKAWSDITVKASADYRNLSHGDYTFKVSSCGFNGMWSKPVEFHFTINPPWWLSVWAYIVYGLILITLIATADALQRHRLLINERERTREKELAQAKEMEKAYNELKNTQAQLVQSEKMASLGELTAGIAHEIQNPLNFVNNFSEVSNELVGEMVEEVDKGNTEEAKAIARDVQQNLEKILHHGKRADAIVKGMLQHSRSSSGVKEPTDLNAIADEYLRLAYHGLRAKDKSFNATMKTDYDMSIGKVNIIPQDTGRVILNLITNAFYVVDEKKKQAAAQGLPTFEKLATLYEPTVTVTTKKLSSPPTGGYGGRVEIRVKDNGNGIPQKVQEKIFQPFFTTKPTGQGTGLGLSLSYDIIKAHGGELKFETKENEGTEFIIILPV